MNRQEKKLAERVRAMIFDNLTPEQMEKAKNCKTPEEILELAKAEGYELSNDELQAIAGGEEEVGWGHCDDKEPCHYYILI